MKKETEKRKKYIGAPIESQQTLPIATPKEIKEVIKLLRLEKAPGLDQVTPQMWTEPRKQGIVLLNYIFNRIIRMSFWPKQFKISQIIKIAKR
jgi:hypothetical protein